MDSKYHQIDIDLSEIVPPINVDVTTLTTFVIEHEQEIMELVSNEFQTNCILFERRKSFEYLFYIPKEETINEYNISGHYSLNMIAKLQGKSRCIFMLSFFSFVHFYLHKIHTLSGDFREKEILNVELINVIYDKIKETNWKIKCPLFRYSTEIINLWNKIIKEITETRGKHIEFDEYEHHIIDITDMTN